MILQKYIFISVIIIFILFSAIFLFAIEKDVHYYYNLGLFKIQQGDYDVAVKAYSMALKQEENNPEIYINLAEASLKYAENLKLKKGNHEKFNKYLNLSVVCLIIVDDKIIDYKQGKEISLFSTPYDKTIHDLQEKAIILRKKIDTLKDKHDKYSNTKIQITKEKTHKKELKPVEKVLTNKSVYPDEHIFNTLLITNGKINKQDFNQEKESPELKKKMILLVKEYLDQIYKNDKIQLEQTMKLQEEIEKMKNKMTKLEKSYSSQITKSKKKIDNGNISEKDREKDEEEDDDEGNKPPEKGKINTILFGGSILLTLLLIIII